ncbi:MAG TPA: cytochrome C oxidase subunit IV family protein [Bryobacteraceae bacterium]|nr:cytochrome C oxidase subunit IV family protein [Bryobacteraceae bacterium]
MNHKVLPVRTYVLIWAILICATFTTLGVAFIDLGPWNIVVALMIAFTKMSLVVLYFMHVKQTSTLTRLFVVAGFFFLGILIFLAMTDYGTRTWLPAGKMW